jgi:hypothetical protein
MKYFAAIFATLLSIASVAQAAPVELEKRQIIAGGMGNVVVPAGMGAGTVFYDAGLPFIVGPGGMPLPYADVIANPLGFGFDAGFSPVFLY